MLGFTEKWDTKGQLEFGAYLPWEEGSREALNWKTGDVLGR